MKSTIFSFSLSLFISFSVNSQALFQDSFNGLTSGQELHGQGLWTNATSSGGSGDVFGGVRTNVVAFPLSYPAYGSSSNSIQSDNTMSSDGPGHLFPSAITSGTFYTSFVINVSDAPPTSGTVYDVIRVLNGSAFSVTLRLFVQESGSGYNFGIQIGDPSSPKGITTQVYNYNTSYLVVLKYTINGGVVNDTLDLFVNPDYANGEPATPTLAAPPTSLSLEYASNVDRFTFVWNIPNSGRFAGHVGLVSVASTWSDLVLSNNDINYNNLDVKYINNSKSIQFNDSVTGQMNIYNVTGQSIKKLQMNNESIVNLSDLKTGIYLSKFTSINGEAKTFKFVVN
ncbi:T9SS type A sorting domain-containing protein [uncultured Winogradskyella sp.]|uniref:T9SS type A sorting domain-containing protein n=1 Tax=uncultured Winogradskyella sp. TaxID=395353 RepID=UPI002605FA9A|nr:T9SS type A sorting domain-containing protein [uncultured Winogradskyella sp.]